MDRLHDRRPPSLWTFILGVGGWGAREQARHAAGEAPCQACGRWRDGPPPRGRAVYCLQCDAASLDGRAAYPGEPVDSRPEWSYLTEHGLTRRVYQPDTRGLRGGVG